MHLVELAEEDVGGRQFKLKALIHARELVFDAPDLLPRPHLILIELDAGGLAAFRQGGQAFFHFIKRGQFFPDHVAGGQGRLHLLAEA